MDERELGLLVMGSEFEVGVITVEGDEGVLSLSATRA